MIIWIAPVLFWLSGKAQDYIDFLRSIPSLIAPKPAPLSNPFVPPFTGGQCITLYKVRYTLYRTDIDGVETIQEQGEQDLQGGILGIKVNVGTVANSSGGRSLTWFVQRTGGLSFAANISGSTGRFVSGRGVIISAVRLDGQPDSCGNVSDPNPAPSIADDGLFNPSNPLIADDNGNVNPNAIVLAPALPLALLGALLAGYQGAMQAAQAALAALEAVKKIAEGLEALKDLWEKLREFLNEWERNRPKKRDVVRQTYGQVLGDGALDFFPSANQKYQSIQLDIVITAIPIGFGKYFGSFSPHRYRYKELGYIAFYSSTQGILEVHSIQFKRTSLQIPKLAVGFIYHLGLNDQIKGYAFGTFSIEKS